MNITYASEVKHFCHETCDCGQWCIECQKEFEFCHCGAEGDEYSDYVYCSEEE